MRQKLFWGKKTERELTVRLSTLYQFFSRGFLYARSVKIGKEEAPILTGTTARNDETISRS